MDKNILKSSHVFIEVLFLSSLLVCVFSRFLCGNTVLYKVAPLTGVLFFHFSLFTPSVTKERLLFTRNHYFPFLPQVSLHPFIIHGLGPLFFIFLD